MQAQILLRLLRPILEDFQLGRWPFTKSALLAALNWMAAKWLWLYPEENPKKVNHPHVRDWWNQSSEIGWNPCWYEICNRRQYRLRCLYIYCLLRYKFVLWDIMKKSCVWIGTDFYNCEVMTGLRLAGAKRPRLIDWLQILLSYRAVSDTRALTYFHSQDLISW